MAAKTLNSRFVPVRGRSGTAGRSGGLAGCLAWLPAALCLAVSQPSAAMELTGGQIGSYLAARSKALSYDYTGAAEHYRELIAEQPDDLYLLDGALRVFMAEGDRRGTLSAAAKLEEGGVSSLLIENVMLVSELRSGDYESALTRIGGLGAEIGPDLARIVKGWAHVGSGDMAAATAAFGDYSEGASQDLVQFHQSLALAIYGDFESAENLMAGIAGRNEVPRSIPDQLVTAWAQALVQLDRRDDAVQLIDSFNFRHGPASAREKLADLRRRILNGRQVDFDFVSDPVEGVSKFYTAVARDFAINEQFNVSILFARMAQMLDPGNAEIAYELGTYLGDIGSHEMAAASFDEIGAGDPAHYLAQIERANSLRTLGRGEESVSLLTDLADQYGDKILVNLTLGYGRLEDKDYAEAEDAFDKAVELTQANAPGNPGDEAYSNYFAENWRPHYVRAIARERQGDWENAKSDLEIAAGFSGGDPYVLNYLGYSMLVQGEDAAVAENLIRRALELEPENGAFIDSLGWAQFLQGRYREALPNLEKAVRLMPNTAEVIDHLGDVYWMVGRKREAEFQWKRALLFEDENVDADRVKRKLSLGLDKVLEEEAAGRDGD